MPTLRRLALLLVSLIILAACRNVPIADRAADLQNLLHLQKQRLEVAPLVARSKWNSGAAIDDPAREAQILDQVAQQARQLGVDENWSRQFFQDQFDAGKIIQHDLHAQWQAQHLPPFAQVPNLAREVRPVLDQLTPALLQALLKLQGHLCERSVRTALTNASQALEPFPSAARERALSALRCID